MKNLFTLVTVLILSNTSMGFAHEKSPEELASLDYCIKELSHIRHKIKEIDQDAFEEVDGYQDPDLMKTASECESALAEAEGTLDKLKRAKKCQKVIGALDRNASSLEEILKHFETLGSKEEKAHCFGELNEHFSNEYGIGDRSEREELPSRGGEKPTDQEIASPASSTNQ